MKFMQSAQRYERPRIISINEPEGLIRQYGMGSMRNVYRLFVLYLLGLSACSSQQFYEGTKAGKQADCLNYPAAEYKECMEDTSNSYEQYRQQRDEVLGE
jgi:hypothetical protein